MRISEARGDRETRTHAERAQRTRVHPLTGVSRPHGLRRDGDHIAAVADINGVVGEKLVQFVGDAIRVNRHAVRLEQRHELIARHHFRVAQLLQPLLTRLAFVALDAPAGGRQYCAQDRARIANQSKIDIAILADRAIVHVDLHQLQVLADALAVAHAEIERRSDNDQHIGARKGLGAGTIEMMRIAGRQKAAAGAVEVAWDIQSAQQRNRFLVAAGSPHLLAIEDRRPFGIDQQIRQLLDVARVAD